MGKKKIEKGLISIITPVYNAEKYLEETIKSVKAQTYKYWELFLINDGSTDSSLEIAKKYANTDHRIKIITIANSGAAAARNKGIEHSNGQYICYIDADDLWKKEKLEEQVNFMENTKCAFSFTNYAFANEQGNKNGKIVHVPQTITYKQALKNTTIFTSTVMLNAEIFDKETIMMPEVKSEDTATWWKILKKIDKAYGINKTLTIYRRSQNTLSSNKLKAIKRTWDLYRKVEKLSVFKSLYYFIFYLLNATRRRI